MESSAGATIVEDTGEMKVKHDTRNVAVHFFVWLQLRGLEGSSGPDQVTCFN